LLETVTHARLRAQQGDRAGALRILQTVLGRRPGDSEAEALLADLPDGPVAQPEPEEPPAAPPTSARVADLAGSFRRALADSPIRSGPRQRLERFLAAVTRDAR
jgi:hypothetical protein